MSDEKRHFTAEPVAVEFDPGLQFGFRLAATISALSQVPTDDDIVSMEALLHDLMTIRACGAPTEEDLQNAPKLTDWRYLVAPDGLRLTGKVVGHPLLGERDRISTSPLYAIDPRAQRWARTWRRYYRLVLPRTHLIAGRRGSLLH